MRSRLACGLLCVAVASAAAQPVPDDPPAEPAPPPAEPAPQPVQPPQQPPPPQAKPAPEPVVASPPPDDRPRGFRFGSYGRVLAGTDLRGGKPEAANVVAHGPRVVEPSYLELDFSYAFRTPRDRVLRPVITLAFDGTLFHDTGDFDARPALRNMFLEAELSAQLTAWVGSRMYRGDDIYLFDYWPLDDLNTVGGGLQLRRDQLEVGVHAGVNRLLRDFQFQQIDVADPEQGARTVVQLNRQRMVVSGTAAYSLANAIAGTGNLKVKVHGEVHALPSGTRKRVTDGTFEELPADTGVLAGVELGTWGFAPSEPRFRRHLNLFMRYAKGLAAFDELAPPTTFGSDLKTQRASEWSFGAAGNWDTSRGNLLVGVLSRRFIDADVSTDHDDGWEYALDVRPLVAVTPEVFAGADLSYQARFPRGLNPITQVAEDPAVFQVAPMIVYSPMGPSAYDRPQLRLVYRAARRNAAARDLFVPADPRHDDTWTYFLGVQAEWWFNSSTYQH